MSKTRAPKRVATYHGEPPRQPMEQAVVTVDGKPLDPRYDLRRHSPTGFTWGYGGSGPSQLALALLCDHFGDDNLALFYYQDFKWCTVADWPQDKPWTITTAYIDKAIGEIKRALGARRDEVEEEEAATTCS